MSKKIFVNRPWLFATALVLVTCLMGMLGGSFAAIFLMWGVTKTIAEKNGMEQDNVKNPNTLGHKIPTKIHPYNNPKNTPNTFIPNGVICPKAGKNPPHIVMARMSL